MARQKKGKLAQSRMEMMTAFYIDHDRFPEAEEGFPVLFRITDDDEAPAPPTTFS